MNEQLQAQLTQILAQITLSVGEIKDFSTAQLPDIVQQYINYGFWRSAFYTGGTFILVIIALLVLLSGFRSINRGDTEDVVLIKLIPSTLTLVFGGAGFFGSFHSLILVINAPKVWFILELKELIS